MRLTRQMSAEDCRLQCSFESVRKTLLEKPDADCLERPLAFWALPTDRRLPIALLNRTISELLQSSFEELSATPGIGQKKIHSLVELLRRATSDANAVRVQETAEPTNGNGNGHDACRDDFDAASVSDAIWSDWCESVRRFGLTKERLGRLAPSLQDLPTVIWDTPLGFYVDHSLSEVRELKTHGEKRVRAVLRVFFEVHRLLTCIDKQGTLAVRPLPRFVPQIESWICSVQSGSETPALSQVRRELAEPLLDQIENDAGTSVRELAEGRWGIGTEPQSVRAQSRQMGVTRARIYQLFEDCQKIMMVRWPEGDQQLEDLLESLQAKDADEQTIALVQSIHGLLYASHNELEPLAVR